MCGIVGVFNHKNAFNHVTTALALLHVRGRDGFGIASEHEIQHHHDLDRFYPFPDKHVVGHALHAVVGDVPQPLKRKGLLISNCEIYNWKELAHKMEFRPQNDADVLLELLDRHGTTQLDLLDGVYAFAYWQGNNLTLARDILGEKPLWFTHTTDSFAFASEKKVLEQLGFLDVQELSPRQIMHYHLAENSITFTPRPFFSYIPENMESYEEMKSHTRSLLDRAIEKRIPQKKFGLLFSGGVDSTYLAHYFKQKGLLFTCYTTAMDAQPEAPDLISAQDIAQKLGLSLKIIKLKQEDLPRYLQQVVPLIEDSNVTKVGVALTFYAACEMAHKDGCKVIFSGLGSEEIFAGYERHKNSANINQECVSGLLKMYERDLYRDDVVAMANNLELRLPFLDVKLVEYAVKIPAQYKLNDTMGKYIFRQIALEKGIPSESALRKKTAAQYGSRIDAALDKLAKIHKYPSKSSYVQTFYPKHNVRLALLFSGGKDSLYAAYILQRQNYQLTCLVTVQSENPDSYMFHTPAITLAPLQAEAMKIPLILQRTKGEKEQELLDLEYALQKAKEKYAIEGVITGAVFSTYQRDRIEKICDGLGLKIFSPLWHKPQEQEMQELFDNNFQFMFTSIAAEGLDKTWLNSLITKEDFEKLKQLQNKQGFHIAGEGGEFESLVLDCPLFKKRLIIEEAEIQEEASHTARVVITKARLGEK